MIPANHISYINEDYRNDLLRHLTGKIFHVTTATAFDHIQRDKVIFHNKSGRLPIHTSSENSYGRKNGWICLFDLRSHNDKIIRDALLKYDFLRPSWLVDHKMEQTESHLTYLFLKPTSYSDLIPNSQGQPYAFYVPHVECWYPGDMSLEHIDSVLFVRIVENVTTDPLLRALYYVEYGLG